MSASNTPLDQSASRAPQGIVSIFAALVVSLRPKQWTKNTLLFAGLLFTLDQQHPPAVFVRAGVAFMLFCLLASCEYLINDILDREADRQHPRKRLRPIASGRLPVPVAVAAAILLAVVGFAGAWAINLRFFGAALVYFVVALAYSLRLKHLVLVDVMALASGFVVRAAAGSFAVGVKNSEWLLLCTTLLALFLGLAKRRGELAALGDKTPSRRILADYSLPLLDQMITIVASTCLIAYSLYTFFAETNHSRPWMMLTIPYVIYGLFRYLYLVHRRGEGEAPEAVLLKDKPLLVNIGLWVVTTILVILLGQ